MELIELRGTDRDWMPALGELFFDVIDGGGSLGFLEDTDEAQMREYWESVFDALGPRQRLWIAREDDHILGTVQLSICGKPNGRHRAEVQKLMVHRDARRRGVAARLMRTLELAAREASLTLLVLDTSAQSAAETFYQSQGFLRVGEIPFFAANPQGALEATALYWKRIG
ncbi:GNAT family N-acetyltransferase [Mitsuaria sp. GD03876]|uniref:GNAT family N-acetyltransferase n=1 Tax=Mitsuaria sp. GD03876 TaxID=2975399 RepID=UPI0024476A4E|nr:GNAT family N-acetyltransferase [Mitsuaria sp. GD03876]MDH0866361.1 GNAT family N-acetyltransferase [Mitsuaria sp. GD03876]